MLWMFHFGCYFAHARDAHAWMLFRPCYGSSCLDGPLWLDAISPMIFRHDISPCYFAHAMDVPFWMLFRRCYGCSCLDAISPMLWMFMLGWAALVGCYFSNDEEEYSRWVPTTERFTNTKQGRPGYIVDSWLLHDWNRNSSRSHKREASII
jgi:hypothetical protein